MMFVSKRIEKENEDRRSKPSETGIAIKDVNNKIKLNMLLESVFSTEFDTCPV
jgi:hypothetical protein